MKTEHLRIHTINNSTPTNKSIKYSFVVDIINQSITITSPLANDNE